MSVWSSPARFLRHCRELAFDVVYGVDTAGILRLSAVSTLSTANVAHGFKYEPVDIQVFDAIFGALRRDWRQHVFIDFGSGKGRALLLASRLPFRRIVGVEFSPELHRAAQRNIRRFRGGNQQCRHIESVLGDAAEFEIPGEPAFFFFSNPFDQVVMRKVIDNISRSLRRAPREAWLVYALHEHCPALRELLPADLFIEARRSRWWVAYRTV